MKFIPYNPCQVVDLKVQQELKYEISNYKKSQSVVISINNLSNNIYGYGNIVHLN